MKPQNKTFKYLGFIALAFAGFAATTAHAAIDTWQGTAGSTDWATDGNWTYSTGAAITTGDSLVFTSANASASNTLTNTLATSFNVAGITFNSGALAYTMTGNAFNLTGGITNSSGSLQTINNDIALSTAAHTINAASGNIALGGAFSGSTNTVSFVGPGTTTLSGTNAFNANQGNFGSLLVGTSAAAPGTVFITGATTVSSTGTGSTSGGFIAIVGPSTLTIQTGGSLAVNGVSNAPANSIIGQNAAGTSTLLVNGGSFATSGAQGFVIGNNVNTATGVLTISSGTVTINRGSTTATDARSFISLARDAAHGTINLNGGTLATDRNFVRDGSGGANGGTANFVFGGGTLKALADQTDWLNSSTKNTNQQALSSVTTTAVSTIDANGFGVAINSAISGTGGFNINSSTGTGTVTFGGVNSYTGATTISTGRLNVISPGSLDTSAVGLGAATLGGNGSVGAVTANNTGSIITNGNSNTDTLTLASLAFTTGATLNLNKANDTFTSALAVLGDLTTTGVTTVNVTTAPIWTNGNYDLISYGGSFTGSVTLPSPTLVKGTISGLGGRQSATLVNTGSSIALSIGGDTPVWTGFGSQTWTTVATNTNTGPNAWALKTGHSGTNFWLNDSVEFNDTYNLGAGDVAVANSTVTIHGGVAPASATFNNTSVNYVINSDDSTGITTGALSKNGDGNVTLTTTNSYTGPTTITAGTLTLGDGTTNGSIATSSNIANDGTLVFNRAGGSFSYANVISGFGNVVKNGTGTQILSGSNTYSNGTTINGGTVQVGSGGTTGALGSGAITNNAALVFNRTNGVDQGTDFGSIDGTGSVTQAGSGTVIISFGNSYSGGTTVAGGILQVGNSTTAAASGSTTGLGAEGSTVTVNAGTLRFQMGSTSSNAFDQNFVFSAGSTLNYNDGKLTFGSATVGTASNSRSITVNGSTTWSPLWNTKQFVMAGVVQGSGDINIVRPSPNNAESGYVAFVNDTNTYSGTITTTGAIGTATTGNATGIIVGTTKTLQNANIVNNTLNSTSSASGLIFQTTTATLGSLAGTGNFILGQNTAALFNAPTETTSSPAVALTVGGSNASTTYSGQMSGFGSLTKVGVGTWTLTGTNTYTGDTTVTGGVLAISGNSIADTAKLVVSSGQVQVTGVETVGALTLGGVAQAAGTYNSATPGGYITGSGSIQVGGGYSTWANTNAGGGTPSQDFDNDGVSNGIEYFMNASAGFTALPAVVNTSGVYSITWTNGGNLPASAYGTQYVMQTSPDLLHWTPVPVGNLNKNTNGPGGELKYILTGVGTSFARLVVTPN